MQKSRGAFDLTKFFWCIIEYLEEPLWEDEVKELLKWWNQCVFIAEVVYCTC